MSMSTLPQPCLRPQRPRWEEISLPKPASPETQPKPPIRILLVDDHPVVIHGIISCLARQPRFTIVGHATDGLDAIAQAKTLLPDVVLMDINMPNLGGFAATATLRREAPTAKVLILTFYNRPEYMLRILRSGASGYLLKSAPATDLVQAIEQVHAGGTFFCSHISQRALNQIVRSHGEGPRASELSDREREVLLAIADGLTNKEIASRLNIAVRTVETHRERLMSRLDIHTTAGLTRFAVQTGLVSLPGDEPGAFPVEAQTTCQA